MKRPNKVFCLFEQSGTFKNAFKRMGIDAEDYDIKNEYGETDHQIDLFEEIEMAAKPISINGKTTHDATIFDSITPEDLIMAFFPCIYFAENNQMQFCGVGFNQKNLNQLEKLALIIQRNGERARFYEKLLQLFYIAEERHLRLIVENPYSVNHYLHLNFPYKPALIDRDRYLRGDKFTKPTQYFFVNCEPTILQTIAPPRCRRKTINSLTGNHTGDGCCNKERSEITPEYATNFINDCILGVKTNKTDLTLF